MGNAEDKGMNQNNRLSIPGACQWKKYISVGTTPLTAWSRVSV